MCGRLELIRYSRRIISLNSVHITNGNLEKQIKILNSHTRGIRLELNSGLWAEGPWAQVGPQARGGAQGHLAEGCGTERGSGLSSSLFAFSIPQLSEPLGDLSHTLVPPRTHIAFVHTHYASPRLPRWQPPQNSWFSRSLTGECQYTWVHGSPQLPVWTALSNSATLLKDISL